MKLVNQAAAFATIIFTGFEANAASINPAEFGLQEGSILYSTTGLGSVIYRPSAFIPDPPVDVPALLSYNFSNENVVTGGSINPTFGQRVLDLEIQGLSINAGSSAEVKASGASALFFKDGDENNGLLEILFKDDSISGADYDGLLVRAEGKFGEISQFSSSFSWDTANISVIELSSITPVPIPAGFPLLLTAIAGFAGLGLRKKRKVEV